MAARQPRIGIDHPTVVPAPPIEGESSTTGGEPSQGEGNQTPAERERSTTERRGRDA